MENVYDKSWKHNKTPTETKPAFSVRPQLTQKGKTEVLLVDSKIAEALKKLGLARDKAMP